MTRAIVIGASAGGVQALSLILTALPPHFASPILIVLHVPQRNENPLVDLLRARCLLDVKEAEDKETLRPGTVYFAPPGYHLLLEKTMAIALSSDEPVNYSRPAIDVLFETAADALGQDVTAIILTGANHDGAQGLRAIGAAGGTVIVQDPATAEMPTMPLAALEACPTARSLSIDEIVLHLRREAA
ncbi:MAG: chemotaxis protein CheB [Sphingobium sp.]|jgi:two-component system, chemotaxis family, protein-glutamate methylesterase/glutaminase|nr:chemotaxis protein CheB [Sphingobium sp.]|tara:strand:+ start:4585 stop:5145 length:561 start_codon:yes stop_codon:yes gene_type:complete